MGNKIRTRDGNPFDFTQGLKARGINVIGHINNIADLRAVDVTNIGLNISVTVLGYYAPGDNGGGDFYYDTTSSEVDNGGTIIKPSSVNGAGRWKRNVTDTVSVKWFGAKGDGVTDDTVVMQKALDSLVSGTTLIIPNKNLNYLISNNINIPQNINIAGPGKITRTHGLTVSNYAFTLNGNNKIINLNYDGGSSIIVNPGNYISIKDFRCINSNIEFIDCTFDNSCGSFIDFTNEQYYTLDSISNLIVRSNTFGNYFDHCIYCQGYKLVNTNSINITGNTFLGIKITTSRQAIKLKNVNNIIVSNNTILLTYGIFIVIESGLDAPLEACDTYNVSITGNSGDCLRFVELITDIATINRNYILKNITICSNSINCSDLIIGIGLPPATGITYACRAEQIVISGNTFTGKTIVINGDINGSNLSINSVVITNNFISVINYETILSTFGNIGSLVFKNNTCNLNKTYDAANSILNRNSISINSPTLNSTIVGYFDISDNTLLGNFGSLISEQPGSAMTSINFICLLKNNKNISSNTSKRIAVLTSSVINTATGKIYAENNISIGGTNSSSACSNKTLLLETDLSKKYIEVAATADKQYGVSSVYFCSLDLGFDPLNLGTGIYYHAYRKADGTYVRST